MVVGEIKNISLAHVMSLQVLKERCGGGRKKYKNTQIQTKFQNLSRGTWAGCALKLASRLRGLVATSFANFFLFSIKILTHVTK